MAMLSVTSPQNVRCGGNLDHQRRERPRPLPKVRLLLWTAVVREEEEEEGVKEISHLLWLRQEGSHYDALLW